MQQSKLSKSFHIKNFHVEFLLKSYPLQQQVDKTPLCSASGVRMPSGDGQSMLFFDSTIYVIQGFLYTWQSIRVTGLLMQDDVLCKHSSLGFLCHPKFLIAIIEPQFTIQYSSCYPSIADTHYHTLVLTIRGPKPVIKAHAVSVCSTLEAKAFCSSCLLRLLFTIDLSIILLPIVYISLRTQIKSEIFKIFKIITISHWNSLGPAPHLSFTNHSFISCSAIVFSEAFSGSLLPFFFSWCHS